MIHPGAVKLFNKSDNLEYLEIPENDLVPNFLECPEFKMAPKLKASVYKSVSRKSNNLEELF